MKTYILYNPLANNNTGYAEAQKLTDILKDEDLEYVDITKIGSYSDFFSEMAGGCKTVICGGDGTLNHFINNIKGIDVSNVYYYATGSGNDFLHDVGKEYGSEPFSLDEYIRDLPTVCVNGNEYFFINGVGYGIDGYCCEVADEMKKTSDKPINYSSIAIKGLLGKFKTRRAKITVDGKSYEFDNVWLAPAMNGRFYGGGMMIAPDQDRKNNETISVVVLHKKSKLGTLIAFPSIFKGEHIKNTKMVSVFTGKDIAVEFDKPTALQIDGETILGVTSYTAKAPVKVAAPETANV